MIKIHMNIDLTTSLRHEISINSSGKLYREEHIPVLDEGHYYVENIELDGDAPKQFIYAYFSEKNNTVNEENPQTWIPYIAKTAEKWYPHESVIEFMINRIGQVLGLKMNEIRLMKINGQIRFLSKYFLKEGDTMLHGAEICGEFLNDYEFAKRIANSKQSARELFTFQFISEAIKSIFPDNYEALIHDLVKMIAFDALVGNNDRHFYNWAVIRPAQKEVELSFLAPIYDSSRGLLWNFSDENIVKLHRNQEIGGKKLTKYIENACPRISVEDNATVNHFGLVEFLKNQDNTFCQIIENLANINNENAIIGMIKNEFSLFFTDERNDLLIYILKERFTRIRNL